MQQSFNARGIAIELEQILTTNGVVSAIDLIGRYLLRPGDTVLVDDPGYFHTFGHLRSLGAKIVGVPWTRQGPDTDIMAQLVSKYQPKAFFTSSVLQNPTGVNISQACAHKLLRLAEEHDFYIVEDDVYAAFHPFAESPLVALDQLNRVIFVDGFAKTVSPKLRVGYLAAHPDLVHDLVDVKLLTGIATSELTERVVHQILLDGHYRKHVARLHNRLQNARERTLEKLECCGLQPYVVPEHGMFVWARFEHIEDTAELATLAAEKGIMLAPGNIFRPNQEPSPWLRFNVAYCDQAEIFEFLSQAGQRYKGHAAA